MFFTQHSFSLMMYRFSSDVLYSASFLFTILTPFVTWDCHYFESNLSLVFTIKEVLLIKKHVMLFCSLLNMKEVCLWVYYCVYPVFHWGGIFKKHHICGVDHRRPPHMVLRILTSCNIISNWLWKGFFTLFSFCKLVVISHFCI